MTETPSWELRLTSFFPPVVRWGTCKDKSLWGTTVSVMELWPGNSKQRWPYPLQADTRHSRIWPGGLLCWCNCWRGCQGWRGWGPTTCSCHPENLSVEKIFLNCIVPCSTPQLNRLKLLWRFCRWPRLGLVITKYIITQLVTIFTKLAKFGSKNCYCYSWSYLTDTSPSLGSTLKSPASTR